MIAARVEQACKTISGLARRTPCRRSGKLSQEVGGDIFLKLENLQESGSFKLRGVANKILSLASGDRKRPLIAASTGNHGAAFAYAVNELELKGRIFLPINSSRAKLEAIREYGIDFELSGDDIVETEVFARSFARENGHLFIPPYNDMEVIAGQGTVAVEVMDQLGGFDAIIVPVGGGGMVSGIGSWLKSRMPEIEIIGCQPVNSAVMYESLKAGRIIEMESLPTLSDGTAGGLEPGSVTFDLCREYVDQFMLLSEDEIGSAISLIYREEGLSVEGAAALAVAAILQKPERFAGRKTVCLVTGSRIEEKLLRRLLK